MRYKSLYISKICLIWKLIYVLKDAWSDLTAHTRETDSHTFAKIQTKRCLTKRSSLTFQQTRVQKNVIYSKICNRILIFSITRQVKDLQKQEQNCQKNQRNVLRKQQKAACQLFQFLPHLRICLGYLRLEEQVVLSMKS
jgi:hypothetical protein